MTDTERLIVTGCKRKVRSAQHALYTNFKPVMQSVCLRYLGKSQQDQDALHDIFIHVFNNIHKYNGHGSLEGWLKRVAVNHCLGILRKKKHFQETEEIEALDIIDEEEIIPIYTKEELENALQGIPEKFSIVFSLFVLDDFSHKEIASYLDIDEKTSRSRLHRAKSSLKNELKKIPS